MAIVVEEGKKPVNWIAVLGGIVFIVVLFYGVYFFFFQKPELIEVVAPKTLEELGKISKITFDPETVLESPTFGLLRQYGEAPATFSPGKSNPFRPF